MPKNQEVIVEEFGVSADDPVHRVIHGFQLRLRDGPLEALKPGQLVRLTQGTAQEAFWGNRTEPVEIGEIFVALQPIQVAGLDACWLRADIGDEVKLSRIEALDFLKKGWIKQKEEV